MNTSHEIPDTDIRVSHRLISITDHILIWIGLKYTQRIDGAIMNYSLLRYLQVAGFAPVALWFWQKSREYAPFNPPEMQVNSYVPVQNRPPVLMGDK